MARQRRTLADQLADLSDMGRATKTIAFETPGMVAITGDNLEAGSVTAEALAPGAVELSKLDGALLEDLATLDVDLEQAKSDVAEALQQVAAANAGIDAVGPKLAELDGKYDGVISDAGLLAGRLAKAEGDVAGHETRLTAAGTELSTLTGTTLPALSTDLSNARTRLATAESTLAPLPGKVATAQGDLTLLKGTTLPALSADLAAAKGRLSTAESTLAPLPAAMAAAQSDLTNAFGELGTVDSRVATAKAAAIADAKLDATAKADAAKVAAIGAAATDAQAKADAALATANAQIAQVIARGQSLVRNGDFEAGNDGWTTSPFAAVETVTSRSGTKSMRVGPNPNGNVWPKSEFVPASTGRTYYVEVWVKRVGAESIANGLGFVIQSKTASGGYATPTVGLVNSLTVATDSWTKISATYTIPTADVAATCFAPWVRQGNNLYYFDDFLAIDVTEAQVALDAAAAADGLARAAQTAAGTAGDNATAALTMAGSKSKVYYDTTPATGVATADGDLWRQRDAANNIVGEWRWNGTPPAGAWVKTMLSSDAISNLDVGKLTAGAATINTAVINKMAVQIATIIQLNADRITAGKITSAQVDTANLSAALATILQLNADRITAGTLGAARINVTELAVSIATVLKLNANVITAGTIDTARLNVTTLAASMATILSLNADRITAGTINVARLNTTAIAAATASIQTVDVKNLFATTGTMTEAVINKLWADVVMSRKVTTEMLAVGAFDNVIPDPNFDGGQWGPMSGVYSITAEGRKGGNTLRIAASTAQSGKYSARIPLAGAASYRITVWVKSNLAIPAGAIGIYTNTKATASSGVAGANQRLRQANGTSAGNDPIAANTWAQLSCVADFTDGFYDFAVGLYTQTSFATGVALFSEPSVTRMTGAVLIEDGAVTASALAADSVVAGKIATDAVTARELKADSVTAAAIKAGSVVASALASELVLATDIVAGNPAATHARINQNGIRVLASTDGSTPSEVVRLGTDTDDYFGVVDPATGNLTASINSTGDVTGQTLSVNKSITLGGEDLGEKISYMPQRLVAWGQVPIDSNAMKLNPTGTNIGLFEIGWDSNQPDGADSRMFEFNLNEFLVQTSGPSTMGLRLHLTTDGSAPTVNSPIIGYSYVHNPGTLVALGITRIIGSNNGDYIRLLVSLYNASAVTATVYSGFGATHLYSTVRDLGGTTTGTAVASGGGGSQGGTTTAPPPPVNPTVTTSKTWNATGLRSFVGGGGTYAYNTSYAYSGLSPAGYGDLSSMAIFPSVTATLSGATVNKVEVYMYYDFWYQGSGGNAYIGLHGQAGLTSSRPAKTYSHALSTNWPRAAGRWVTLSSSTYAGFKSGQHKGITLGGSGGGYERYGYAHDFKLRITYTK